jgi:hypothetical protein
MIKDGGKRRACASSDYYIQPNRFCNLSFCYLHIISIINISKQFKVRHLTRTTVLPLPDLPMKE